LPLAQFVQVGGEARPAARALVVVPEPPEGLDRLGVAVLIARLLDTQLDQVLQRADHVSGVAGFPQPDQLKPLLFRHLPQPVDQPPDFGRPRIRHVLIQPQIRMASALNGSWRLPRPRVGPMLKAAAGKAELTEVSEQVAWRAATLMREYRRSHTRIGLGDYLIAATALTEGLELATLNVRHYPMFPGLARPFPT